MKQYILQKNFRKQIENKKTYFGRLLDIDKQRVIAPKKKKLNLIDKRGDSLR